MKTASLFWKEPLNLVLLLPESWTGQRRWPAWEASSTQHRVLVARSWPAVLPPLEPCRWSPALILGSLHADWLPLG